MRGAFQQYMAPEVIAQVLDRPELLRLGGEEKRLTAMFADIRGFTSLSEGLTPTALVDLLNEYLSEMTEIIFSHQGTLDKYIGDAIMAFWGAPLETPDHAERACRAALGMSVAMEKLQDRWEKRGPAAHRHRHRHQHRPNAGGQHGIGAALQLHHHGGRRQSGVATGRRDQTVWHPADHQPYNWEAVRTKIVTRELDLIRVKGQEETGSDLPSAGADRRQATIRGPGRPFRGGAALLPSGDWSAANEVFPGPGMRTIRKDGPVQHV